MTLRNKREYYVSHMLSNLEAELNLRKKTRHIELQQFQNTIVCNLNVGANCEISTAERNDEVTG